MEINTSELQSRLLDVANRFINDRGGLPAGEQISVLVSIGPAPKVQLQIINNSRDTEFEKEILQAISRIPKQSTRTRLKGALASKRIFTKSQIELMEVFEFYKIRNLGKKSIIQFAEVLKEEGISANWISIVLAHHHC